MTTILNIRLMYIYYARYLIMNGGNERWQPSGFTTVHYKEHNVTILYEGVNLRTIRGDFLVVLISKAVDRYIRECKC